MQPQFGVLAPQDILLFVPDPQNFDQKINALIQSGTPFTQPEYPKLTENAVQKLTQNIEQISSQLINDAAQTDSAKTQAKQLLQTKDYELVLLNSAVGLNAGDDFKADDFTEAGKSLYGSIDPIISKQLVAEERQWLENYSTEDAVIQKVRDNLLAMWPESEQVDSQSPDLSSLVGLVEDYYSYIIKHITKDYYSAEELVEVFNKILEDAGYAELGWKAILDPEALNLSVSVTKHILKVSPHSAASKSTVIEKAIHEIGVHVRRSVTAERKGNVLLQTGLTGYQKGEEGLGIALETVLSGAKNSQSLERARRRYIYQSFATGIFGDPMDFTQLFEIVWRRQALLNGRSDQLDKAKHEAGLHVFRHFRGTPANIPGLVFAKDIVYYTGYVKTVEMLLANPTSDYLDLLTSGRFNQTDKSQIDYAKEVHDAT